MAKILEIEKCRECKHMDSYMIFEELPCGFGPVVATPGGFMTSGCKIEDKPIKTILIIPDWCPLEDVES
jgi:hypothetical protein